MQYKSTLGNSLPTSIISSRAIGVLEATAPDSQRILAFSNAIASARDRNVLSVILKNQLKQLFDIEDYIIYTLSDDKKAYRVLLYNPDATFVRDPHFQHIVNTDAAMKENVFKIICRCSDSSIGYEDFNSAQIKSFFSPKDYITMTCIPIILAGEIIAVMAVSNNDCHERPAQQRLFRSLCSQIALTVGYINSNEKLQRQLYEIERYKQVQEEEKSYLREEIETTQNYSEIVGGSPEMLKIFQLVAQVASSDSTVLLLGETGTGKELIARAIHSASPRKDNMMIKVNCAALPANLIESELFGHERGSFTGATERRVGKFELANGGTLFLDEIGEMPLDLQVKLLRALQEREIERLGGKNTIKVDVRIIAATNRDLETEMHEGRFRKDLFYRLNIFPIGLPPLRERKEDIPGLASYFTKRFAAKAGKTKLTLSHKAVQDLVRYSWPGNIRELEHFIERSVLMCADNTIKQVNLPAEKQNGEVTLKGEAFVIKTIDENERDHILSTLKYCNGRVTGEEGAAQLLGIPPSTLNSKMKKLGIRKEHSV